MRSAEAISSHNHVRIQGENNADPEDDDATDLRSKSDDDDDVDMGLPSGEAGEGEDCGGDFVLRETAETDEESEDKQLTERAHAFVYSEIQSTAVLLGGTTINAIVDAMEQRVTDSLFGDTNNTANSSLREKIRKLCEYGVRKKISEIIREEHGRKDVERQLSSAVANLEAVKAEHEEELKRRLKTVEECKSSGICCLEGP